MNIANANRPKINTPYSICVYIYINQTKSLALLKVVGFFPLRCVALYLVTISLDFIFPMSAISTENI